MGLKLSQACIASYWYWFQSFNYVEQPNLEPKSCSLDQGRLTADTFAKGTHLLVSPFSYRHEDNWVHPIWLAVLVDAEGQLLPHPDCPMMYVPNKVTDAQSQPFCHRAHADLAIKDFLFTPDQKLKSIADWDSFYQTATKIFKKLNLQAFEQHEASFQCHLLELSPYPTQRSELLNKLQALPAEPSRCPRACSSTMIGDDNPKLTANLLSAIDTCLQIESASVQSVDAPIASAHPLFAQLLIANLIAQHGAKIAPLRLGVVGMNSFFEEVEEDKAWLALANKRMESDYKSALDAKDALKQMWLQHCAWVQQGLKSLQSNESLLDKAKALQAEILNLQLKDEKLEDELEQFQKVLKAWRQTLAQPWVVKLWRVLTGQNRNRLSQAFLKQQTIQSFQPNPEQSLEEQLIRKQRALKVARTKCHQNITTLSDKMTQTQALANIQDEIYTRHPEIKDLSPEQAQLLLLKAYGSDNWKDLQLLLKGQALPVDCQWIQAPDSTDDNKTFDWLLVFDAHQYTTPQMASLLAKSQRVIAVGDSRLYQSELPIDFDSSLARHCLQLEYDEELDDLQSIGQFNSQNGFFDFIRGHDVFYKDCPSGLIQEPALSLQDVYINQALAPLLSQLPKLNTQVQTIEGKLAFVAVKAASSSFTHEGEANAIASLAQADDCIVTVFPQQQALIEQALLSHDKTNSVVLLNDLAPTNANVLLSLVLSEGSPKPHPIDCGDKQLYKLICLAKKSLTVFAQKDFLESSHHTPLALLARHLKKTQGLVEGEIKTAFVD